MNQRTQKIRYYRSRLAKLLSETPEANETKHRYRSIRFTLVQKWTFLDQISKEAACEFLKDVVFVDRELRKFTEGRENDLKKKLADEKIIELETLM